MSISTHVQNYIYYIGIQYNWLFLFLQVAHV